MNVPKPKDILLFDTGCVDCSHAAQAVKKAVGSKLDVRGLDEPAIRHRLDSELGPDWKPAPMLITDTGVKRGPVMAAALLRKLGPRKSAKVLSALGSPDNPAGIDRRAALVRGAALAGAALGIGALRATSPALAQTDTDMKWLRENDTLAKAAEHLGPIGRVWRQRDHFIVEHSPARKPALGAATAIGKDGTAVSYAFVKRPKGLTIEWMMPGGYHLASTLIKPDGKTRRAPFTEAPMCASIPVKKPSNWPPKNASDDFTTDSKKNPRKQFLEFLAACMTVEIGKAVDEGCAENCFFCFTAPSIHNGSCASCFKCAGGSAFGVVKHCLLGCPPAP